MSEVIETKQPKTTKEKVMFGLKIAGNVVFYAVIIFLFLFSLMNINAGGKGGIPNLFGKGFLSVQSDSMNTKVESMTEEIQDEYNSYSIGQFAKGDLLNVDIISKKQIKNLKVGDVVTFWDESLNAYNTHRIVYIEKNDSGEINILSTQGDKSVGLYGLFDPSDESKQQLNYQLESNGEVQSFSETNLNLIKAKVTSVNYGAGKVLDNIQQNWLFYFVIPVLALLLFEVFMVVKNIMDLKGEKQKAELASDKDAMMAEIEAEKEKMRQELLAELMAQQKAAQPVEEPKAEEVPAEPVEEVAPEATEEVKPEEEGTDNE